MLINRKASLIISIIPVCMLVLCSKKNKDYAKKNPKQEISVVEKDFAEGEAYFKEKKGRFHRSLGNVLFLDPSSSTHYQKAKTMIETAVRQYEDYGISPWDIERIVVQYPDIWVNPSVLYDLATGIINPNYEKEIDSRREDSIQVAMKLLTHLLNRYTEYDNEPFVYFYLAKGFLDLKKASEAKQYFTMFIDKFPHSEFVDLAKKFLNDIPKLKKYGYVGDFGEKVFGGEGEFGYLDIDIYQGWFKRNPIIDIEVDNQKNVYVADKINKRIVKYNSEGDLIWQTQNSILPLDIEVDQHGDLYIIEGPTAEVLWELPDQLHSISKYTSEGERLLQIQFPERSNPYSGAAALYENGQIILIDKYFERFWIKQLNSTFTIIQKDSFKITSPGPFKVCLGENNDIYVIKGHHLSKMSTNLELQWTIKLPTTRKWPSQSKMYIDYDMAKRLIYVLFQAARDDEKSQLFIVKNDGTIHETREYDAKPYMYIISNANGECFKAMYDRSSIRILSMYDSLIVMLNGKSTLNGQFLVPSFIKVSHDTLVVIDLYLQKKIYYAKDGKFLKESIIEVSDTTSAIAPSIDLTRAGEGMKMHNFTFGREGNLYLIYEWRIHHGIQIYDKNRNLIRDFLLPETESLFGYHDIEVSRDGKIFVTHSLGNIFVLNHNGDILDKFGRGIFSVEPVDCFSMLAQIAVDSEGSVYAIDQGDNTIKKFMMLK